jgi:hypothetical protein
MQRSIRIETVGDLAAHGYGLNAMCERCRHRVDLDLSALIDRFGVGFVYVGKSLDARLRCSRCGEKRAAVQIHTARNTWKPE